MLRKHLAERRGADGPGAGQRHLVFKRGADTQFGDGARPPLSTRASLVAETTQVIPFVAEEVAITWDVKPGGAMTERRLVLHPVDSALGAGAEVMIHQVVPQLSGR